jgi:hypothetical protein
MREYPLSQFTLVLREAGRKGPRVGRLKRHLIICRILAHSDEDRAASCDRADIEATRSRRDLRSG